MRIIEFIHTGFRPVQVLQDSDLKSLSLTGLGSKMIGLCDLFIKFRLVKYPVQMSFCPDCGKFVYTDGDHYCSQCGSPIEKISSPFEFTKRQIEAFNDPCIRDELCNTEAGRWMLKEAAKEGLINDPKITKSLLES